MTTYKNVLDFKEPTKQQVALSPKLVGIIKEHSSKSREHLFHLCMIAYGLRKHNFIKKGNGAGGNAQGYSYKPEFEKWYEENDLYEVYGKFPANFTLYAMVGRLLNYTRWQVGEEYMDRLPKSLTALYELSQIIWTQGDTATDKSRALYKRALNEVVSDGSKNNKLIHPNATRKDINSWRMNNLNIGNNKKPSERDNQFTIAIATVKVHKDLFSFTKRTGEKRFGPKLEDVKKLITELNHLIEEFDSGKSRFAMESNLEKIEKEYADKVSKDFGEKIQPRKTTKSAPTKKTTRKKV